MSVNSRGLKEFIDDCISSGSYVETGLELPQKVILEIEDILNRYNDTTARSKIRKIIRKINEQSN